MPRPFELESWLREEQGNMTQMMFNLSAIFGRLQNKCRKQEEELVRMRATQTEIVKIAMRGKKKPRVPFMPPVLRDQEDGSLEIVDVEVCSNKFARGIRNELTCSEFDWAPNQEIGPIKPMFESDRERSLRAFLPNEIPEFRLEPRAGFVEKPCSRNEQCPAPGATPPIQTLEPTETNRAETANSSARSARAETANSDGTPVAPLDSFTQWMKIPKLSEATFVAEKNKIMNNLFGAGEQMEWICPDDLECFALSRNVELPSNLIESFLDSARPLPYRKYYPSDSDNRSRFSRRLAHFSRIQTSESIGDIRCFPENPAGKLHVDNFTLLVLITDLRQMLHGSNKNVCETLVGILAAPTMLEVIDKVASPAPTLLETSPMPAQSGRLRIMRILVIMAVVTSMVEMGISLDYFPDHIGWNFLKMTCATIFVAECILGISDHGCLDYFFGKEKWWHMIDIFVALTSVIETMTAWFLWRYGTQMEGGMTKQGLDYIRLTRFLRILSVGRAVRLFKNNPIPHAQDLVNMLLSVLVGGPALISVMIMLCMVMYIMGLVLRLSLGPVGDVEYWQACGDPDMIDDAFVYNAQSGNYEVQDECPVHLLFGEVYFHSVQTSMFTLFRMVMGDYGSYDGKSLVVAFGVGYGMDFRIMFCASMVAIHFGLFNIITAVFVDSTIQGLKHNELRTAQANKLQNRHLRKKFGALAIRLVKLCSPENIARGDQRFINDSTFDGEFLNRVADLTYVPKENFEAVFQDEVVESLCRDLEIDASSPLSLLLTLNPSDSSLISMHDLLKGLMRMRGEPSKHDIISCWASIEHLKLMVEGIRNQLSAKKHVV